MTGDIFGRIPELEEGERGRPLPDDTDGVFAAPWQARAFAMAVALYEQGTIEEFDVFQQQFIEEVQDDDESWDDGTELHYYDNWLSAIETVAVESETVSRAELLERAYEFQAEERDASEFVEGDPHPSDDHSHDH